MTNPDRILPLCGLLFLSALASACVDSSINNPAPLPPPAKPSIDILPATWTSVPGKQQTFQATDPVSNSPLIWTAPEEVTVLATGPTSITLISGLDKGQFELKVRSAADSQVEGCAQLSVKSFNYSGSLAALPGDASQQPLADVAVTRGLGSPADSRVFMAYFNPTTGANELQVHDLEFANLLDVVPGLHFNPAQPPHVAADAQGRAYLIEQYYDASAGSRKRGIVRRNADGSLDGINWNPAQVAGLQLVPGTDIACDDDGTLYFLTSNGVSILITRFTDMLGPNSAIDVLGALNALGPQVQLAVDADNNLLVAVDSVLSRWTPAAGGAGMNIEVLVDLGSAPVDLDADGEGAIYAAFATQVDIFDTLGNPVGALAKAKLTNGTQLPFENLRGLGVDGLGNLRLADDPLVDDPQVGISALRTFALDYSQP